MDSSIRSICIYGGLVSSQLHGFQQGPMDISRMGRYVIDASNLGNSLANIDFKVIPDINNTWGPGLYAYQDRLPSGINPQKLDNIYWVSLGLWEELTTQFMYEAYSNSNYPTIFTQKQILEIANQGIPASLFRLHTSSNESMKIADSYQSPPGYIILSPQFVPRDNEGDSTNGYLISVVFTPKRNEIWIFEAWNLKNGPICKLHHPQFNIGYSFHTAWLPQISSRASNYKVSVKQDYQNSVETFFDALPKSLTIEFLKLHKDEFKKLFTQLEYLFELQPKEKDLHQFSVK